jgi:hypothetical protein
MPGGDRDHLIRVLCDADEFWSHLNDLLFAWQVAAHLGRPVPWRLLPFDRLVDALAGGPDVLTDAEVAVLLDDPFSLEGLATRIHGELPDVWLDHLAAAGARLRLRYEGGVPVSW